MTKELLRIEVDDDGGYILNISSGTSVNEVAFAINALARSLTKSGYIDSPRYFTDKVNQYIDDPQFAELMDESEEETYETETVSGSSIATD